MLEIIKKSNQKNTSYTQWLVKPNLKESVDELLPAIEDIQDTMDSSKTFEAALLCEELLVNIADYSYKNIPQSQQEVTISMLASPQNTTIEFVDTGNEFDYTKYKCKPINPAQIGGHGIRLLQQIPQKIKYKRKKNKNITTIKL